VAIVHRRRRSGLGLGSDVCHREGVMDSDSERVAFFIWWESGEVRVRVGLGRVYTGQSYRVRVRVRVIGLGLGLGSDVCQGGGDRIVTLKVVFSHFHLVGER